jgi:uncharacterized protein (TIGR00730 family)
MKNIAIFCGSSSGKNAIYTDDAKRLGTLLAANDIRIVYGGGSVGLMETVAQSALDGGGEVTGVITEHLVEREVSKPECNELLVTQSMSERKQSIVRRSEGVVALPGGYGTMDELFEVMTLIHLELCAMPVIVLNTNGFYDDLARLLDKMETEGFIDTLNRNRLRFAASPEEVIQLILTNDIQKVKRDE